MGTEFDIGAALLAMKPEGVLRIEICHQYKFDATMCFDVDGKIEVASARDADTASEALAWADVKRLAIIAKRTCSRDKAAAEFGPYFAQVAA